MLFWRQKNQPKETDRDWVYSKQFEAVSCCATGRLSDWVCSAVPQGLCGAHVHEDGCPNRCSLYLWRVLNGTYP